MIKLVKTRVIIRRGSCRIACTVGYVQLTLSVTTATSGSVVAALLALHWYSASLSSGRSRNDTWLDTIVPVTRRTDSSTESPACTYRPHTSTYRPPGWSSDSLLQDQHQNSGSRPTLWVSKHLKNKIQLWQTSSLLRSALTAPLMALRDVTSHIKTQPSRNGIFIYTASVMPSTYFTTKPNTCENYKVMQTSDETNLRTV